MKIQIRKHYFYYTYYKQHALQYLSILSILHKGVSFTPQLMQNNVLFWSGDVVGDIDASDVDVDSKRIKEKKKFFVFKDWYKKVKKRQ